MIKLSIAIVTRNRPESLSNTLKCIYQQTYQPYEVIISDDSDDEFCDRVKQIVHQYKFVYIKGPKRGLYANRNFVAKQSTGTHFRTIDDDHSFLENHFQMCIDSIQFDPKSIWIIGEYFPNNIDYELTSLPSPGQLNVNGVSSTPTDNQNSWAISCGASIYPISVVLQDIMYCEIYNFGNLHLEYGARLFKNHYRIRLITTTFIIHNIYENERSYHLGKKEIEINFFLSLCFSLLYFPSFYNKISLIIIFIKLIFKYQMDAFVSCFKSFKSFKNYRKELLL